MASEAHLARVQSGFKPRIVVYNPTTDFPILEDGSTMHLQVKPGDVANLILSVGDEGRATRIAQLLDDSPRQVLSSSRGFKVITGTFGGTPVSIIATGMGLAMMDFVVRECRYVVSGPLSIIRLGTTGILKPFIQPGSLITAKSARCCQSDFDLPGHLPYRLTEAVPADSELVAKLEESLKLELGEEMVTSGVNISCDFFYSSQGRSDPNFVDCNDGLINYLTETEPEATNLEMETFCLLKLAQKSRGTIKAAAASIGLLNRVTHETIPTDDLKTIEISSGYAVLRALTK